MRPTVSEVGHWDGAGKRPLFMLGPKAACLLVSLSSVLHALAASFSDLPASGTNANG